MGSRGARSYDPVIRESKPSFGISKSAISSRFKVASGQRAQDLRKPDLSKLRLCALLVDGVEFRKELFVVALGIDKTGAKTILGYHQGATENQEIWDRLLAGMAARGLDLRPGRLAILDGGGAVRASIRKPCGEKILVQRCQQHIAGRDPRLPEGWKVLSRASPCEPGSLGSDMVG
jgi:hypothetical protein